MVTNRSTTDGQTNGSMVGWQNPLLEMPGRISKWVNKEVHKIQNAYRGIQANRIPHWWQNRKQQQSLQAALITNTNKRTSIQVTTNETLTNIFISNQTWNRKCSFGVWASLFSRSVSFKVKKIMNTILFLLIMSDIDEQLLNFPNIIIIIRRGVSKRCCDASPSGERWSRRRSCRGTGQVSESNGSKASFHGRGVEKFEEQSRDQGFCKRSLKFEDKSLKSSSRWFNSRGLS